LNKEQPTTLTLIIGLFKLKESLVPPPAVHTLLAQLTIPIQLHFTLRGKMTTLILGEDVIVSDLTF
jgi:hypothetical protein